MKLSVKEAAARACVCESVIRGWLRSGLLRHRKDTQDEVVIEVENLEERA